VLDTRPVAKHMNDVLPLARTHGLSAYDAAYLELSIRHSAPLATLDDKLRKAAKLAGVMLFDGKWSK
jgi:predicted nucleic acid-binding protein